jgi:hypothetical protein
MKNVIHINLCLLFTFFFISCSSKRKESRESHRPIDFTYKDFDQNSDSSVSKFEFINQMAFEYSAMLKVGEHNARVKSCEKQWCQKADSNNDKKIEPKEYFKLVLSVFEKVDRDNNSIINKKEFSELQKLGVSK